MIKSRPYVAANLHAVSDFHRAIRAYLFHPAALLVFAVPPLFKLLNYMPVEFPVLGLVGDIAFYSLRIAVFYIIALRFEGPFTRWLMQRNVPFAIGTLVFWLANLLINFVILHALLLENPDLWVELGKLARLLVYSVFYHAFVMIIIKKELLPILGTDPRLIPYFRPVSGVAQEMPAAALIDPDLEGDVLSLQAQNQYVRVETAVGVTLVRTTLRAAIDRLPAKSGLQVHRSWWVSNAVLASAAFEDDDANLLANGQIYPVGKTYQPAVLAQLAKGGVTSV